MATKSTYSIPTYRYLVIVGDDEVRFDKVSGLELSVETIEYKDGTGGIFRMPGERPALNVSLRHGIVIRPSQCYDWLSAIQLKQADRRDISIRLTNEDGSEALITWNLTNALPTKLTAPGFEAASSEVLIEELCLLADSMSITTG